MSEEIKITNIYCRNCAELKHGNVPCIIAMKQREAGEKINENWKNKYCLKCLKLKHPETPHEESNEIFIKS